MAVVHYKFKNSVEYDSITFDGLSISLRDLKTSILKKKKMRAEDTDLQVVNAQTAEEYSSPSLMIPKNTSLIIARIPVGGGKKTEEITAQTKAKKWAAFRKETQAAISAAETGTFNTDKLKQSSDLVNAQSSEIEKIAEMIKQSTKDFDPSNYTYKVGPSGTPNPSYICRRCGKGGHFIQNCTNDPIEGVNSPSDLPRMKRPTGIPVDSMVFMDEPLPGTYQTHTGKYAVPKIDVAAYVEGKKERPPFLPDVEKKPVALKRPIPKELKCPLCGDLARDAVVIPCCGISYCDECIRDKLLESEDHVCPSCDSMDVSPDGLIANQMLRRAVTNFQNETGYVNIKNAQAKAVQAAQAAAAATKVLNKIQSTPVVPRGPSVLDYKPPSKPATPPVSQPAPPSVQSFPPVKVPSTQVQIKLNTTPQKTYTPASVEQEPPTPTQDEPVRSTSYTQPRANSSGTQNVSVGEPLQTLVGQVAQPVIKTVNRPATTGNYDPYYKPSVTSTPVPPPTVPPYPPPMAYPPPVVPLPYVPAPVLPVVRPPIGRPPPVMPPVYPPPLPPRPAVPVPVAPLNLPKPLSETEFLHEKNRILREELQQKAISMDPLLEFAKKLEERRVYRSRSRSRTPRSRSRSLSRPRYRSRSRGRSISPRRSPTPRRSSLTPRRSSLSPRRSYSPRRYSPRRSRSPRYSPRRYYSPRRSRTPRSLSPRNRFRSYSRSPVRRRSFSRSRSRSRKRSPFRRSLSRSPVRRRSPFRSYSRGRYTPPRRSLSPYRRSPIRRLRSKSPVYRRSRSPIRFSPKRNRSPLKRSPIRKSKEKQPPRAKSPKSQRETKRKTQPVKQKDRDRKEAETVPKDSVNNNKNIKTMEPLNSNKHLKTVEPNKENIPAKSVQSRASSRSNNIVVSLVDTTTTDDNSEIEEKHIKADGNQNENAVSNKSNDKADKTTKSAVESKDNKALGENENKQVSKSEKEGKQRSRSRSKSKDKQAPSTRQNKPKKKKSPKKREKSLSLSPERVKEPLKMPYRDRFEGGRGRIEGGRERFEVGRERFEGGRDRFEGGRERFEVGQGGYGRDWDRNREADPYFRGRQNAGFRGRDFRGRGRGSDFRGIAGDFNRGQQPPDFRPPDFRQPPADFGGGYPPIPDPATIAAQYGRDYPQRGSPGFPGNYGPNFPYPPPRDPREDPNFQGMVRDEDIVKFEQYKQFYDFYTNSRTYGFPPAPVTNAVPSGQTPPQGPPPAPPGTTPLPTPTDRAGSPGRRRSISPRRHRSRSPGRREGKDRRDKERDFRERRSPDRRRDDRSDREDRNPEHKRDFTPEKKYTTEESDGDAQNPEKKSKEHEEKESKKEKKARKKKEKEGGEKKKKKKKDKEKTKTKKDKVEKKTKKSKLAESSDNEELLKSKSKRTESQNESESDKSDSDTENIVNKRISRKDSTVQSESSDHEISSKDEGKLTEVASRKKAEVEENSDLIKKEIVDKKEPADTEKIAKKRSSDNMKQEQLSDSELSQGDNDVSRKPEKRRSIKRGKPEVLDTEEVSEPKKAKFEETVKDESKEEKMDTSGGASPAGSEGFDDIPHPEDELMLEPPELSKWEKWEKEDDPYDLSPEPTRKKEKWKPSKQTFLPRSVIEKAEHALAQKVMKPTTVSSAVSVIQPTKKDGKAEEKEQEPAHSKRENSPVVEPKRRVFMEPQKKEDERRVASKQHSVKITVTGDEKRKVATDNDLRNKLREKRREGDHSRDYERTRDRERERSPERKRKDSHSFKDRRSSRDYDRQDSRGAKGDSNRGRDSGRVVSRKDSVIDDSRFVPDYNDSYSDDDDSEYSNSDSSSDEEVVYKKHKHKKNKHKKDKKLKKKKDKKKKKHKGEKEKKLKSSY